MAKLSVDIGKMVEHDTRVKGRGRIFWVKPSLDGLEGHVFHVKDKVIFEGTMFEIVTIEMMSANKDRFGLVVREISEEERWGNQLWSSKVIDLDGTVLRRRLVKGRGLIFDVHEGAEALKGHRFKRGDGLIFNGSVYRVVDVEEASKGFSSDSVVGLIVQPVECDKDFEKKEEPIVPKEIKRYTVKDGDILVVTMPRCDLPMKEWGQFAKQKSESFKKWFKNKGFDVEILFVQEGTRIDVLSREGSEE